MQDRSEDHIPAPPKAIAAPAEKPPAEMLKRMCDVIDEDDECCEREPRPSVDEVRVAPWEAFLEIVLKKNFVAAEQALKNGTNPNYYS